MIDIEIKLSNYRCFGDDPVILRMTDGFTALVGVNNSGKSSLLRVPYEIRSLLIHLTSQPSQGNPTSRLVLGAGPAALWSPNLLPGERVQRAGADRPMKIELTVRGGPHGSFMTTQKEQLILSVTFDNNATSTELKTDKGEVIGGPSQQADVSSLELSPFKAAMQELADAMYVGPFRNAINVGAQQAYYDIQTGDAFVTAFASYKSGPLAAQNEAVYELLQELKRIFGFNTLDVDAAPDSKSLQLTVDGRSYRLGEQGAGLAHFIVVLVNVLIRRPSFLLIDEPELNLHEAYAKLSVISGQRSAAGNV